MAAIEQTVSAVRSDCVEEQLCPTCNRSLLITEFGVCRARSNGRNLYCKECVRQKVKEHRVSAKEYREVVKRRRAAASRHTPKPGELDAVWPTVRTETFVEMVFGAIKEGKHTQKEIAHHTKLDEDTIGTALAQLLLWQKSIEGRVLHDSRNGIVRGYFAKGDK